MELKFSMPSGKDAPEKKEFQAVIVGGGPAAVTAGIYLKRKEVDVAIISDGIGGEVETTTDIDNYPGFPKITGPELSRKFREHLDSIGVAVINDRISRVEDRGRFVLHGSLSEYTADAVIIATGSRYRELDIPGEREFRGRGVSYCATCDAPFFRDKVVAVVGGGNTAMVDAQELAKIAKKVYLIHRRDEFRADPVEVRKTREAGVEFILNSEVKEVLGGSRVEKIRVVNNKTGEEREIGVDGLFVAIGMVPNSAIVEGLVELNGRKEIVVDMNCETSREGIFAAGDVTSVRDKQIIVAAGMGAVAALSAYEFLRKKGVV